ncbi:MAG TPA: sigma-70 family RNA polymerase sigma factor [Puia sp.]
MTDYPEKELVENFMRGDPKAFKEIYDIYFNRIFVFAIKLTGAKEEAEDIALDSFTKLFKMYRRFENLPNIQAFLYVTTRNACLNYLKYRQTMESKKKEWAITNLETETWLEINQIEGEMLKAIYNAVEELPKGCKDIIKMYLEGLNTAEISTRLHISAPTVRSQKRYAIQLLKAALRSRRFLAILVLLILYFLTYRQLQY